MLADVLHIVVFLEICQKLGVKPENALMIGNDEGEDMKGASEAGLMCYLATDCRIMAKDFIFSPSGLKTSIPLL